MAFKLSNKTMAVCDINTFEGRRVELRPGQALMIKDPVSNEKLNFYKAYEKVGLKVIVEKKAKEKQKSEPVSEPVEQSSNESVGKRESDSYKSKDLSKLSKAELLAIAEKNGFGNLSSYPKAKVIEVLSNG